MAGSGYATNGWHIEGKFRRSSCSDNQGSPSHAADSKSESILSCRAPFVRTKSFGPLLFLIFDDSGISHSCVCHKSPKWLARAALSFFSETNDLKAFF